jgi:hypothetical protein
MRARLVRLFDPGRTTVALTGDDGGMISTREGSMEGVGVGKAKR